VIRLVINGDDLGLHPAIDAGLLEAHRDGVLTSATLLVTGRSAEGAAKAARAQGLAVGVHLCLTTNLPPAAPWGEVPSVAPGGRFRSRWPAVVAAWLWGKVRLSEVERELRAQVARARELGVDPDHLDGHQHLHVLPGIAGVVQRIARDEGLPLRWPTDRIQAAWIRRPGAAAKTAIIAGCALAAPRLGARRIHGIGVFEAGQMDEAALLAAIAALPDGDHEIGLHPGHAPDEVPEEPGWRYGWESELAALRSPKVRSRIAERGIHLVSYRQLSER